MTHLFPATVRKHLIALGILFSILWALPAFSQMPGVNANVPFRFSVGARQFPAGAYRIDFMSQNMVRIRTANGVFVAYAMGNPELRPEEQSRGKLVFFRIGDATFLHEIWMPNRTLGFRCYKSRAEKESMLASQQQGSSMLALNVQPQKEILSSNF